MWDILGQRISSYVFVALTTNQLQKLLCRRETYSSTEHLPINFGNLKQDLK